MAKVNALSLSIYKNPLYHGCANGGWTENNDELFVACPSGPHEVEVDDPSLFVLRRGPLGSLRLEPNVIPDGMAGPMMGGCYAATSDSRFSEMCEHLLGHRWYGAVAVHDRFDTWEAYRILTM